MNPFSSFAETAIIIDLHTDFPGNTALPGWESH